MSASLSFALIEPLAVNANATPESSAACPGLLSANVKLKVPTAKVLSVIASEVIVVFPDAFLAKIVKSNSSFSASVVCA